MSEKRGFFTVFLDTGSRRTTRVVVDAIKTTINAGIAMNAQIEEIHKGITQMANEKLSRDALKAEEGWQFGEGQREPWNEDTEPPKAEPPGPESLTEAGKAWAAAIDAHVKAVEAAQELTEPPDDEDDPLRDSVYPSEPPSNGHSWRPGDDPDARHPKDDATTLLGPPRRLKEGKPWILSLVLPDSWECRIGVFLFRFRKTKTEIECTVLVASSTVFYEIVGDEEAASRAFVHFLSSQKMQLE